MKEIKVSQYMQKSALVLRCDTPMQKAVDSLFENKTTGAPVIGEDQELLGFISEKDCIAKVLSSVYHGEHAPTVNEVMITNVVSVDVDDNVFDVAQMMVKETPKLYPVMEANKCVGVISRTDVLNALVGSVENCFGDQ